MLKAWPTDASALEGLTRRVPKTSVSHAAHVAHRNLQDTDGKPETRLVGQNQDYKTQGDLNRDNSSEKQNFREQRRQDLQPDQTSSRLLAIDFPDTQNGLQAYRESGNTNRNQDQKLSGDNVDVRYPANRTQLTSYDKRLSQTLNAGQRSNQHFTSHYRDVQNHHVLGPTFPHHSQNFRKTGNDVRSEKLMTTVGDPNRIGYSAYGAQGMPEPLGFPLSGEFQDRSHVIQRIQQQQQQRRGSSPFRGGDSPLDYGLAERDRMTAPGKDSADNSNMQNGASNGYTGNQGLPGDDNRYHGDRNYHDNKGLHGETVNPSDRDYHSDRNNQGDPNYQNDRGHYGDLGNRGQDYPSPRSGERLGGSNSDDEVERELEHLRQLHEKAVEEKRQEEERERQRVLDLKHSPEVNDQGRRHGDKYPDENGANRERERDRHRDPDYRETDKRRDQSPYHYSDSSSRYSRGDRENGREGGSPRTVNRDRDRGERESPSRQDRSLVPQSQTLRAESPESLRPRNQKYYRGYSQKHYSSAPNSEPSYSRDASPEALRSRSQPYLRLLFDSDDYNNDSNNTDNDPGVTFDRYARRATRAHVLSKAEELLNRRQSQGPNLYSISETNGESSNKLKSPRKIPVYQGHRKVAFQHQNDDEEEDEEEEDDEEDDDGDSERSDDASGHVIHMLDNKERVRKSRLMQVNARMRNTKRRGRVPFRGAGYGRGAGAPSVSEYDQYESSESEDDVVRYSYDDPTRFEASRVRSQDLVPRAAPDRNAETELGSKGKARRAWFCRNGDPDFRPKLVVISQKTYPNLETLLVALGQIVPTVAGVKYLFSWPDGKEIKSVTEIQNGRYYICASVNRLKRADYGNSREQYWRGGKFQPDEAHLFTKQNGQVVQSPNNPRPRVITLISNMYRDSHEKLILNTSTTQNYEDVLQDLHNMVVVPHPPVTALYTESKPHIKVEGFAHLFRDLKDHKNFLVCGQEGQPIEPKKRPLPSSNSSNDSLTGKHPFRKLPRGDGRLTGDSVSPNRRPGAGGKRTEPIRFDVNGKKREFFAPSEPFQDSDGGKPEKKLKLDWVYGFRGRDVKQNLVVLPNTGELVYFVASIVVLYDRRTHTQKHYTAHTEEVTCLAIHPRDPYIASGQVAGRSPEGGAHIRVWDGISLSTYAVIGLGVFQQGVSCVSFSERDSNGDLLLAIDDSDRHVMSVWEWQTETLAAKTTTTNDPVVFGCFYPFDDTILITFGKQHMYFWTVFWKRSDGRILRDKKSGIFEDDVPKFVTSICFGINGDVITGDSTGSILVWSHDEENIFRIDRQASAAMKHAHKKSVSSLVMLSDGVLLSGGGSEIKAWDSLMRFKLLKERALPESHGPVRTIVPQNANGVDGYLFVSTARDIVLEGSLQSKFRPIVQGHCEELWAMAAHPKEPAFFTAGHDMAVAKWSALSHNLIWVVKDKKPCTSIGVDPGGQLVAVGTTTGRVALYSSRDGQERNALQVGKAQINALSFSQDGSQLAVGAHDGFIHVFVVHDDGQFFRQQSAALRHNNTFIMHLDWSSDGRYLQTVLGDYELIFWDVSNMQKLKSGRTVRDVDWNTFSSPVGYPLVGAWQGMERGDVINVCCRSHYRDYIATGDSVGRLRLYKYPAISQKAESRTVKPFSSNTTAIEFMADDNFLIASGGSDAALVQYELVTR